MTGKLKITICIGSACFARGNARNIEAAERFLRENDLADKADIEIVGKLCSGKCADGPNVIINGVVFNRVTPERMTELLKRHTEQ